MSKNVGATCTWGDGADVTLFVDRESRGMTAADARFLADQLYEAASAAEDRHEAKTATGLRIVK